MAKSQLSSDTSTAMDPPPKPAANLFQVFLRLRPPPNGASSGLYPTLPGAEHHRFLTVEPPAIDDVDPTHITLVPPQDNRRRAVERFGFTRVFEEHASQLDLFEGSGVIPLVEGVLGADGCEGRDGLLATLGVTGSGKSHTILGTRSQRGMIQLALDLLFRSIEDRMLDTNTSASLHSTIVAADYSEAQVLTAQSFFDSYGYGDHMASRASSRAPTPMIGETSATSYRRLQRPSTLPQLPSIESVRVDGDLRSEYAVVISMYEVYNDRIFDLLTPATKSAATKEYRRRHLLFKSTEQSPDRKVVAGLRKVICSSVHEALMVLEAGLHERRVAGTGSNSVSSRSHGFFCVEVKRRRKGRVAGPWAGSTLTIVDLAGSERARDAKTQGATLVEAGKINESLMYLGQCLQMQSDSGSNTRPNLVPFRQCKLTELLFSNSFPTHPQHLHRPQKAVMIVTADPNGDYNATSQILRYSALAREITVPRIPSVSATILASSTTSSGSFSSKTSMCSCGRSSPSSAERETMEIAALEIARMSEEIDGLRDELVASQEAHMETQAHLISTEERLLDIEMEIRESVFAEMEARMENELRRWKARMAEEADLADEHVDRKLEVLMKGLGSMGIDDEDKENAGANIQPAIPSSDVEALQDENVRLRAAVQALQRELQSRSPTKSSRILQESRTEPSVSRFLASPGSPNSPRRSPAQVIARSPLAKLAYEEELSDDDIMSVAESVAESMVTVTMPGTFRETPAFEDLQDEFVVHDDQDLMASSLCDFESARGTPEPSHQELIDDDVFRPQNPRLATLKTGSPGKPPSQRYKLRGSSSMNSLRSSSVVDTPRASEVSVISSTFTIGDLSDDEADATDFRASTRSLRSNTRNSAASNASRVSGAQTVSRASQLAKERRQPARQTRSSTAAAAAASAVASATRSNSKATGLSTVANARTSGSPVKKVRQLTARRWGLDDAEGEF